MAWRVEVVLAWTDNYCDQTVIELIVHCLLNEKIVESILCVANSCVYIQSSQHINKDAVHRAAICVSELHHVVGTPNLLRVAILLFAFVIYLEQVVVAEIGDVVLYPLIDSFDFLFVGG